ncbi:MAG: hypothetical protein NPIRA02_14350 [Nitrospirales bacterium]|nr:MAG: hypothetical protein NPIRA02_14350 [Nitrospirales bacterium]
MFWVNPGTPSGSGTGYRHPHVVVQNNVFNRSRIHTVIVCTITSNLKRATSPGNVLRSKGETNLTKESVINVTQLFTIDKEDLEERIGKLSTQRLESVLEGVRLILEPRDIE